MPAARGEFVQEGDFEGGSCRKVTLEAGPDYNTKGLVANGGSEVWFAMWPGIEASP